MNTAHDARPSRLEIIFAVAAVCLAILFSFFDILRHPGAAFPDELTQLQWLQEHKEGLALPLSFAKGSLQRLLLAVAGAGYSIKLYLPALLAFSAECSLLYLLGRRLFSKRAGLWAVIVCALSSFTLLRLRSLLSYSIFPFELLLLIYLMLKVRRSWTSLILGFVSALMLLDYEAWIFGLALLGLILQVLPGEERPAPGAWLTGMGLGIVAVFCLSWGDLASYVVVRQSQNLPHSFFELIRQSVSGLKGYWLGGPALAYTGVKDTSAFPIWAWLLLLTGIFSLVRGRRWLLLWVVLGLLPLLSKNSGMEPQRAILAWPVLCLLAGVGAERLLAARRWILPALILLACSGAVYEARAYAKSMAANYLPVYGPAASVLEIYSKRPTQILTEFDNEASAAWRFMLPFSRTLKSGEEGRRLALLPRAYCLEKNQLKGIWLQLPDYGPCLLEPDRKTWERLSRIDAELGALWRSTPRFNLRARRREALNYYLEHPRADVWVKTACLEQVFGSSFLLGEVPLDLLKKIEGDELASASLLLWCATKLQVYDPAWSLRLLKRAHSIDPSKGLP